MTEYRITKYNPMLRKTDGRDIYDDWTSVSDIGQQFKGKRLELSEYLVVEDAYVETVRRFLKAAKVTVLRVKSPEAKNSYSLSPPELSFQMEGKECSFPAEMKLSGPDIDWVVRINLRERFWCRLEGDNQLFIHFGWDYYMYLGTKDPSFVLPELPPMMFAEVFQSPYKE